jgi:hypothetical protein
VNSSIRCESTRLARDVTCSLLILLIIRLDFYKHLSSSGVETGKAAEFRRVCEFMQVNRVSNDYVPLTVEGTMGSLSGSRKPGE